MNRRTPHTHQKHAEMQRPYAVRASADPGVLGGSDESGDGGGVASSTGGPAAAPGKLRRIYRDFAKGGHVKHEAKDSKLTKASVDYSMGMGTHRCRNCTHFNPEPSSCDVTSSAGSPTPGRIDGRYWCKKFDIKRHFAGGGSVVEEMAKVIPELADKVTSILKPSRLKEVRDHILDNGGAAQAVRFDQAADTSNLSRFSNNALKKAFYPGESGLFTTLRPSSFEDYAARLPVGIEDYYPYIRGVADMKGAGLKPTYDNYMDHLAGIMTDPKRGAASLPTLWLRSDRFTPFPEIAGHEGRHRMRSMAERLGDHDSLVALQPDKGALPSDPEVAKAAMLERYFPGGPDTMFTPQWDNDAESIGEARDMIPFVNPVFAKGGRVGMAGGGSALEKLARKAIKVFHSSPHVFDKFDSSKIGTGEGVQAYGHGLYFAESPKVANYYRNTLAGNRPNWLDASGNIVDPSTIKDRMFRAAGFDGDRLLMDALQSGEPGAEKLWWDTKPLRDTINKAFAGISMGNDPSHYTSQFPDDTRLTAAIDHLVNNYTRRKPGATYEVSLFHDPAMMLNLDRKIDEQPDILQDALRTSGERFTRATTGGDVLNVLEDKYGPRDTALRLADRGITGTRFWDQNSRGFGNAYEDFVNRYPSLGDARQAAMEEGRYPEIFGGRGTPTRNYVSFPGFDDLIEIDKQYAQGGSVDGNPPSFDFQTPPSTADALPQGEAYAEGGAVDMAAGGLLDRLRKAVRLIRESPIAIGTPDKVLDKVIADKRFKSQFETSTSGGSYDPDFRTDVEHALFNTPLDIDPQHRPIYGHVPHWGYGNLDTTYGGWKAFLDPSVRDRSTFTFGDSFGIPTESTGKQSGEGSMRLSRSDLGPYFYDPLKYDDNNFRMTSVNSDPSKGWSHIREPQLPYDDFDLGHLKNSFDYIEAQMHGGVPLSDVRAIVGSPRRYSIMSGFNDRLHKLADESGIPMFLRGLEDVGGNNPRPWYRFEPGSMQRAELDDSDMRALIHQGYDKEIGPGDRLPALFNPHELETPRRVDDGLGLDPELFPEKYAEGGAVDMAGGGSALEKLAKLGKRLLGVHNTSARKLDMMETLGGNPVPSIAVLDPAHGFNSFGDISLVGDPKLVTPSRTTPVFGADVYSPRFPSLNDEGTKIFRGFDDEGNRRYAKLTLPNVVREMKGNIRGGEGGNFGAGTVRAMVTPQFKSLADIRDNDWRLISNDEFSKLRPKVNDRLINLAQDFYPHWKYGGNPLQHTDDFSSMLGEYAHNLDRLQDHYKPLPEGYLGLAKDFMNGLRDMPTEYFEAKPQRAVDLSEFKHAVIPAGRGQYPEDAANYDRVADILKSDHGLDVTRYNIGPMGDRLMRDSVLQELVPDLGFAGGGAVDGSDYGIGGLVGGLIGGLFGNTGKDIGSGIGTGLEMVLPFLLSEGGRVPGRNDDDLLYNVIQDTYA